jgi:hypothetical protein
LVLIIALLAATGLAALAWQMRNQGSGEPVGLFSSLPIVWNEAPNVAAMLNPQAEPHWAKAAIARTGPLVPLDFLGPKQLAPLHRLVIAQPRPLSPQENVAIDAWLRGGGKLLVFADPMLTEETRFAIGDKRRPQDIAMLDPILNHWGLELKFDPAASQPEGQADVMDMTIPVDLPGRLSATGPQCRAWGQGELATCKIGRGRLVVLADAAVLDRDAPSGLQEPALRQLLDVAFPGR